MLLAVAVLVGCDDDETPAAVASKGPPPAIVGQPPTVDPSRGEGEKPAPPRPTVLTSGRTAEGDAFEYVIYGRRNDGRCLMTMYPNRPHPDGGGGCGTAVPPENVRGAIDGWGSGEGTDARVYGFIDPGVDSVELTYDDDGEERTIAAASDQIPRRVIEEAGGRDDLGVFVAYLPEGVAPNEVTAYAYDANGREMGTAIWPDFFEGS